MATNNMYAWTSGNEGETWNPVSGGPCPHECAYCYAKAMMGRFEHIKKKYSGDFRIDEKAIAKRTFKPNVFMCSMTDLFCEQMPENIIDRVLLKTRLHPNTNFLLQSKNPSRMYSFRYKFPRNTLAVTTVESNKVYSDCKAPSVIERVSAIKMIKDFGVPTSITIEPIMKFDLIPFVEMIAIANPTFVAIGADSKRSGLKEPSKEEVLELIKRLMNRGVDVKLKDNIDRIIGENMSLPVTKSIFNIVSSSD